ncbi:DUF1211 domain-containing protein [Enterococcus sp. DIV0242_7C1]|uniref:Integral membrane protein n=2 Tax=Enterococcus TaxID=1350 RepID=A0A200JDN0_9ENTE|nr:DUF1211 domain-containing protein [Enterococcus sp. DIV0242_7C1]OUZ35316.1 hypothetical protein A5889_000792 [Enterococcus sp. 9D6_DIV0238]
MEKMKERVVMLGDAIIAIIITIMVLDLPIKLNQSGNIELELLFRSVGIYFISFCFVGNFWYQTAQVFNLVNKIKNKDFVVYMILMFFLSLVPAFTRLLIEDTNREIVLMYGLLTFIVTIFLQILLNSLEQQINEEKKVKDGVQRKIRFKHRGTFIFRIFLLVLAYFYPKLGLVVYLGLPIFGFLQNIVTHEEDIYVDQMNDEQRKYYFQSQSQPWDNGFQKYAALLRSSMNNAQGAQKDPEWWHQFNHQWQSEVDRKITEIDQELAKTDDPSQKQYLNHKKEKLENQRKQIDDYARMISDKHQRPRESKEG